MALSTELDIYKAASELLGLALDVQDVLPRTFRTTLGTRIMDGCADMVVLVSCANTAYGADRVRHIEALQQKLQVMVVLLRLCHEHPKRLIHRALWSKSVELTNTLGKQSGGWLKWARGNVNATSAQPLSAAPVA